MNRPLVCELTLRRAKKKNSINERNKTTQADYLSTTKIEGRLIFSKKNYKVQILFFLNYKKLYK